MKKIFITVMAFILGGAAGFIGSAYLAGKAEETEIVNRIEQGLRQLGLSQVEVDTALNRQPEPTPNSTTEYGLVDGVFMPFNTEQFEVEIDNSKAKGQFMLTNNSGYDISSVDIYVEATMFETVRRKETKITLINKARVSLKNGETGVCRFSGVKVSGSTVDLTFDDVTVLSGSGRIDGKTQSFYVDYKEKQIVLGELPEEMLPEVTTIK